MRNIVAIIIIGICLIGIGFSCGGNVNNTKNNTITKEVSNMIEGLPPGTEININIEENETPSSEYQKGNNVNVSAKKDYGRFFSWFGLGATEAAVKDQGMDINNGNIEFGVNKGYGVLEQLWNRLKTIFWSFSFIGIALVILLFIPATAPIAGMILRGIASIIPVLGSFVERIVAGFKWKKPLSQTISGGQMFKKNINESTFLTAEQKTTVIDIFRNSMMIKQDNDSQKTVTQIKTENGI